ncbi:hypothetical protein V6R86_09200 [Sphingomonas kaistensis]|uniref:Uncharacterized protein n=1 Tax=Sphingomonas kaistensis TaxID=298708 RepID=A0ABZ2G4U8_9SPHN
MFASGRTQTLERNVANGWKADIAEVSIDCSYPVRQHNLMNDHERGLLAFVAEPNRSRMERLLQLGPKRRGDARSLLRSIELNPRFSEHLKGSEAFPLPAEVNLRRRGAPSTCYVFASDSGLDGREMLLGEALEAVVGMGEAALISCIPGHLAFYEGDYMKMSYVLSKPR